jgi:hypothetical protein
MRHEVAKEQNNKEGGQQKVLKASNEVRKQQDANVGNNVMNKGN